MSERIRGVGSATEVEVGNEFENGVRESTSPQTSNSFPSPASLAPAHPSNRLTAQLNKNWRVADDPQQWILQRRKGNPRRKSSGWQDRSFCRTRDGLLRCVRGLCGEVNEDALTQLRTLPDFHSDWERSR
jgi:hypothetical protein